MQPCGQCCDPLVALGCFDILDERAHYLVFQATESVESSSFGSELVAARIARDLIVSLRIKLRMFGCPMDGPANVFCDNQGVVKNACWRSLLSVRSTSQLTTTFFARQRRLGFYDLEMKIILLLSRFVDEDLARTSAQGVAR